MKQIIIMIFIPLLLASQLKVEAQNKLAYAVFGNGGSSVSNQNNNLYSTIGQPIIGNINNTLYTNNIGFWYQYAETITDVEESWMFETPREFELFQNYPNPFNPTTIIRYGLPKESSVKVIVYNILGEMVVQLVNATQKTGYYEVNFNASNLASGVYIYPIQSRTLDGTKDFRSVKKMILVK